MPRTAFKLAEDAFLPSLHARVTNTKRLGRRLWQRARAGVRPTNPSTSLALHGFLHSAVSPTGPAALVNILHRSRRSPCQTAQQFASGRACRLQPSVFCFTDQRQSFVGALRYNRTDSAALCRTATVRLEVSLHACIGIGLERIGLSAFVVSPQLCHFWSVGITSSRILAIGRRVPKCGAHPAQNQ